MSRPVTPDAFALIGEPMISAKQAADALRLPTYWFSDRQERARKRIPHYQLVGLVRFRLSELIAWTAHFAQPRPAPREGQP